MMDYAEAKATALSHAMDLFRGLANAGLPVKAEQVIAIAKQFENYLLGSDELVAAIPGGGSVGTDISAAN